MTEEYTDEFAKVVHAAWGRAVKRQRDGANVSGGQDSNPNVGTSLKSGEARSVVAPVAPLETVPAMPLRKRGYSHRPGFGLSQQLAVARSVNQKERRQVPEAAAACSKEWNKLVLKEAWDMKHPKAKKDILEAARDPKNGFKAHFGR